MIHHNFRPLAISFGREDGNSFVFQTIVGQVKLSGCNEILPKLLYRCDGERTIEEVISPFAEEYDEESLTRLVGELVANYIICDSRHLYRIVHLVSSNLMSFHYALNTGQIASAFFTQEPKKLDVEYRPLPKPSGSVFELLQKRASSRNFAAKPTLSLEEFSTLTWCILGRVEKDLQDSIALGPAFNIPSGGRTYSLEQFVIVVGDVPGLDAGVYHHDKIAHKLGFIKPIGPQDVISREVLDLKKLPLETLLSVHVVTARIWRATQKYANRGYRYVFLEAGHSAQNAYLAAAELGLVILEYGGFHDRELASYLGLSFPDEAPLITLLVGKEKDRGVDKPVRTTN